MRTQESELATLVVACFGRLQVVAEGQMGTCELRSAAAAGLDIVAQCPHLHCDELVDGERRRKVGMPDAIRHAPDHGVGHRDENVPEGLWSLPLTGSEDRVERVLQGWSADWREGRALLRRSKPCRRMHVPGRAIRTLDAVSVPQLVPDHVAHAPC